MKGKEMADRTKKFLWTSMVGMILVCIVVFIVLAFFMNKKTRDSIQEISAIYMEELNGQLQEKFSSVIDLRLGQVGEVVTQVPQDRFEYGEEMCRALTESILVRNFDYVGFLTKEGILSKIYGEELEIFSDFDARAKVEKNGHLVGMGINSGGDKFLLLGQPAAYPMAEGEESMALVAGVSMEYLNEALFLDEKDGQVYSHIIDKEGNFVIRNGDAYRDSYFERVRAVYGDYNGTTVEEFIRTLQEVMAANKSYSGLVFIEGEERQIYCSPIADNAGWYLITVMRNETLNAAVRKLDHVRSGIMIGSSLTILICMVFVFWKYFGLTQQQVRELDKAKEEAVYANKAKSNFLSSMSHDIRTPMNAIIGMTEIARKNINDPERVEDSLKKVMLSSKHLLGLINDVLDMSKIESGKMTINMNRMSLRDTMDDIVNIIQPQVKARNQYFDIFIRDILSEDVYCDSVRLNQVLLNLLSNAVKFTQEEGRIDVYVYQEKSDKGENYVRTHFEVEDNGIGMSREFQEKIWDTFSRESSKQVQKITGTGLGMAITKRIVDFMDGTIELHSELGKGSRFHVILDLEKAESPDKMELPKWNVLVVDDNEMLCRSAVANLEELGVRAEWTLDGKKAVEMIEERHNRNDDYRFVLIDWKMPKMNGLQTISRIRERVGKGIPVFLISAYDWSEIEDEARNAEIEGFISKPLFRSTLYECLRHYAERASDSSKENENEDMDFTGKRLLLAEDIEINWEIANELLTSYGFEMEHAENGKICVDMISASEVGYYDAVLMDIRMPVMNGYDATKLIRALDREDKDMPIIAMTADAFENDIQYCLRCGMNAHVAKPLDLQELLHILQKLLKK